MSRFIQFKEYVKNPPPEQLAKIEYQGHFLNIIGILAVSVILFLKGYWYIIFALIFSTMVSYSQGMGAYQKYKIFKSFLPEETFEYILQDKSFTRIRQRIVKKKIHWSIRFILFVASFGLSVLIMGMNKINWIYTLEIGIETFIFYALIVYLTIGSLLLKRLKKEYGTKLESQTYA
jgi:hypothetical protein